MVLSDPAKVKGEHKTNATYCLVLNLHVFFHIMELYFERSPENNHLMINCPDIYSIDHVGTHKPGGVRSIGLASSG